MSKMLRKGKKSECGHTVQSNEICYSGPVYTHLITCTNRYCETQSTFEDTPTTCDLISILHEIPAQANYES